VCKNKERLSHAVKEIDGVPEALNRQGDQCFSETKDAIKEEM